LIKLDTSIINSTLKRCKNRRRRREGTGEEEKEEEEEEEEKEEGDQLGWGLDGVTWCIDLLTCGAANVLKQNMCSTTE
jgi:hypothetical protein